MKIKLWMTLLLCVSISQPVKAAIQNMHENKAYEILQMPNENQKDLLQKQPDHIYGDFVKLAFDEGTSMKMRWKALMAAAMIRKEKATPDLLKASKNSQWYMRSAAMTALAEYNPAESERVAQGLLKDKALVVRSTAVDILGQSLSPQVRDLFWEELHQKYNFKNKTSLWIRPQILAALAKRPLDQETPMFSKLLREPEQEMQLLAVQGLEKLTGMKLGNGQNVEPSKLIKMWQNYYK
jgi:hypothetical protein